MARGEAAAALGLAPTEAYRWRVVGLLNSLGLDGEAKAVRTCGRWRTAYRCGWTGNLLSRQARCGRQVCPDCGQPGGDAHRRRVSRAMGRVGWFRQGAYLVLTVPPELRPALLDREALNRAIKAAGALVEAELAPAWGAMVSVHYFGDRRRLRYAPTVEVVLPGPWRTLRRATLHRLRVAWREALARAARRPAGRLPVVHYSYRPSPEKWRHTIRYVLRPTVSAPRWIDLEGADRETARAVAKLTRRAHQTRYYGALGHRRWPTTRAQLEALHQRPPEWWRWNGAPDGPEGCPCCGWPRAFEYVGCLPLDCAGPTTQTPDGWTVHERAPPSAWDAA